MLKLKNAIIRYTNKVSKSRRSSAVLQDPLDNDNGHYFSDNQVMQVDLDELTDIERKQFILWWNDINPFHLNELDNAKALDFLSKFELPENKLEQIFSLFRDQKKGLSRAQFFAVLRLIGHAQNDKRINPAYIHIGAPIPLLCINTDVKLWSRRSCDTTSSFSTLHSPTSPFDDDQGSGCIRSRRSKSYPFIFSNTATNDTCYDPPSSHLLLTQPFKPKFINVNVFSNSNQISPPPLPPQSTKPTYPKYAKRMSR